MRLCQDHITSPSFDRAKLVAGVVHFGPGAFHRAHQGYYFNLINANKPEFGIIEIALNSRETVQTLKQQDCLYSINALGEPEEIHIISAIKDAVFAPENPARVIEILANPAIKIITSTITEKGYCLRSDGTLDMDNPAIRHDIANPDNPKSYIGYVIQGLLRRYNANIPPFIVIPCDNISDNGKKVKNALCEFARKIDDAFAQYLQENLIAPSTMVDSITPKSDEILFHKLEEKYGFSDPAAVWREIFTQWVIETYEGHENVPWQAAGVTLTPDVAAFEQVKLRILNGAHSTLAYVGWCLGFDNVAQAMANPAIFNMIKSLIFANIIPSLSGIKDIDLNAYADAILTRFKNPALQHQLAQIAWDGSQKIGFRILPSIRKNLAQGHDISLLCLGIAGWIRFIIKMSRQNAKITDPIATRLGEIAHNATDDENDINGFIALEEIFGCDLALNPVFVSNVKAKYKNLIQTENGGRLENL